MKVGIIGMGVVGQAMARLFAPHADVVTFDLRTDAEYPEAALTECDFAVVCVDTPSDEGGACDTRRVFEAVERLPVDRVLLKSTVAPGTTDELAARSGKEVCFSPEYMGESPFHDYDDAGRQLADPFVVLGGQPPIRRYFIDVLLAILGPTTTYFQCEALEAELVKYAENSFLATKVTFVNEMASICAAFGADWNTVREGWLLDRRIGRSHTAVFAQAPGFGGRCLPKDVVALVRAAERQGYKPTLLTEVLEANERFRMAGMDEDGIREDDIREDDIRAEG